MLTHFLRYSGCLSVCFSSSVIDGAFVLTCCFTGIIMFCLVIFSITKLTTEIRPRVFSPKAIAYVLDGSHLCGETVSMILTLGKCSGVSNSFAEFCLK